MLAIIDILMLLISQVWWRDDFDSGNGIFIDDSNFQWKGIAEYIFVVIA